MIRINNRFKEAIQVCYDLNPDNTDREINGLIDALTFFEAIEGIIVTLDQTERIEKDGKTIRVVTANDYLLTQ